MNMEVFQTTEPMYIKIFQKYLKYLGIFPTELELHSPPVKISKSGEQKLSLYKSQWNIKIRYVTNGALPILVKLNVLFCITQSLNGIVALLRCILYMSSKSTISLICWLGPVFCGTGFGMKNLLDGPKISELINRAAHIESEIVGKCVAIQ
jgi:hypothetical protein